MKYLVLKTFGGYYEKDGEMVKINAGMNDIIDLPETGHDFEKAGLIERVPDQLQEKKGLSVREALAMLAEKEE